MHPLDRPVWAALSTRQREFAIGDERARRLDPEIGLFAAAADAKPESLAALAALAPAKGVIGLVETLLPSLSGLRIVRQAACVQMVAVAPIPLPDIAFDPLSDEDAVDMLELATLTEPGPFFARTHQLGDFIGIRHELFDRYARNADFIQTYIFPGGCLLDEPNFAELARERGLSWERREGFRLDYAETLRRWRERYDEAVERGALPGFAEPFHQLWRYYLMYCEGGFRGGAIDVAQVTMVRS